MIGSHKRNFEMQSKESKHREVYALVVTKCLETSSLRRLLCSVDYSRYAIRRTHNFAVADKLVYNHVPSMFDFPSQHASSVAKCAQ